MGCDSAVVDAYSGLQWTVATVASVGWALGLVDSRPAGVLSTKIPTPQPSPAQAKLKNPRGRLSLRRPFI